VAVPGKELLVADDPYFALSRLLTALHPAAVPEPGVHPTAVVGEGSTVDPSASLGPYVVLGRGSRVRAGAVLHAHVVVGRGCTIGEEAVLHPHAVLYDQTEVGARTVIHAGVVLGSDGFGYATHGGVHHKIPQVGRVVVEEEVEIGANSAVDRATLGETRIGRGSKLDNLVQVGHNVEIGPASILCGQAGVAGSARLGRGVVLGGQAGVANHLTLGDGVQVAAKSAVLASAEAGTRLGGIPAIDLGAWRRRTVLLGRLEEMARRLRALERRLEAAGGGDTGEGGER
jgi:UDP-3-O-[3-hydroxymyristoyl] glucosamine N-acyltransferase